ncbi:MAG: WG repeat-containing protein, partial [bacterium]|nr:WG repeat-containing protein [Candidatus Aphodosoma intestinipullorum]
YRDGLALVRPEGSEGYIYVDHNQEKAIEDTFASATVFNEGVAWVARKGGHLEAIDTKGKRLFELKEAEGAFAFKEGVAVFMRGEDEAFGVVNKKGEVVVKPSFTMTSSDYDGGLLIVGETDGGFGFVDKKGEVVIPMEYDRVLIEESDRFIDNPTRYNFYGQVETGRIPVKKNGKWGGHRPEREVDYQPAVRPHSGGRGEIPLQEGLEVRMVRRGGEVCHQPAV